MRKFRFIYVLMAALFFVACAESDDLYENETNPVAKNPYEISIETAMQTLETMFPEMMRTTRVSASEVKTLRRSDLGMTTRAEDEDPQAPVAYIIPLANNGCAIMGADTRKERLYAALESTTLTPDDIARAVQQQQATRAENTTDSEGADGEFEQINDIKEFASGLIANSILDSIQFPPQDSFPNGGIDVPTRLEIVATDTVKQLLNTKWHQEFPFNIHQGLHPITGDTLKAGCGPIALAQVINYHHFPIEYNNISFDWNKLAALEYPYPHRITPIEFELAGADLVYMTRQMLRMRNDTITSSRPDSLRNTLRRIGYESEIFANIQASSIKQVIDFGYCAFTCGYRVIIENGNTKRVGHVWVIDGYRKYKYNYVTPFNTIFSSEDRYYAHYNLGWGGNCDGYYLLGTVDFRDPLEDIFIEPEIGDIAFEGTSYYDFDFYTVIYQHRQ